VRSATALGGQVHLAIKPDPRPRRPIVLQGGERGTSIWIPVFCAFPDSSRDHRLLDIDRTRRT